MKLSEYINKYGDFEINDEKVKELIVEKKSIWIPKLNEIYWVIDDWGIIDKFQWRNNHHDFIRYDLGNCFKTQDEAIFTRERLKVINELKNFALENNEYEIDWNDNQSKCEIVANPMHNRLVILYPDTYLKGSGIYFTSREIAQKAIETIGENRIKKYLFGGGLNK